MFTDQPIPLKPNIDLTWTSLGREQYVQITSDVSLKGVWIDILQVKPVDSTSTFQVPRRDCLQDILPLMYVRAWAITSSNAIRTWHVLLLVRTAHSANPRDSLRNIKLKRRLRVIQRVQVVHDADFDHLGIAERRAVTPKCAPAVAAEVRRDLVAGVVALLRDGLWAAGGN